MKSVRIEVSIAGERFDYEPGQVVELEDDLAQKWASDGRCTILGVKEPVERADQTPPEKALSGRGKAKQKGRT